MDTNEKEYVSQLVTLATQADNYRTDMFVEKISGITPHDIRSYCKNYTDFYVRCVRLSIFKPVIDPSGKPLELENALSYGSKVVSAGFNGTPKSEPKNIALDIWGHVLDVCDGTFSDIAPPVVGDEWRRYCASLLNEKSDLIEWSEKEIQQKHDTIADFLRKSCNILRHMSLIALCRLSEVDVNKHPVAGLATISFGLWAFRDAFLRAAVAIGPYSPTAECPPMLFPSPTFSNPYGSNIVPDLISNMPPEPFRRTIPGILQLQQFKRVVRCVLTRKSRKHLDWYIWEWTDDTIIPEDELIPRYEVNLFFIWSYTTGEFLGYLDYETEERAHWFIPYPADLYERADEVEEAAFQLITNTNYESLAKRVIAIVREPLHADRVRWSYIRELDDVIQAFSDARRVYNLEQGISTPIEAFKKQSWKQKRKSGYEKTLLIAKHLKANPTATSPEIAEATDIHDSEVRRLWVPIKQSQMKDKRYKPPGWKTKDGNIEAEDKSASCGLCGDPLSKSFECKLCNDIIVGECKECHYTNSHLEDAIP